METTKMQWFKLKFENQRDELLKAHQYVSKEFEISKEEIFDEMDLSSLELEQSMRMRLINRETLFLKKLDEALVRIANGTFGTCTECEEEIELRRLEARPTATTCIECKEASEHTESVHMDGRASKSLGRKLALVAAG